MFINIPNWQSDCIVITEFIWRTQNRPCTILENSQLWLLCIMYPFSNFFFSSWHALLKYLKTKNIVSLCLTYDIKLYFRIVTEDFEMNSALGIWCIKWNSYNLHLYRLVIEEYRWLECNLDDFLFKFHKEFAFYL